MSEQGEGRASGEPAAGGEPWWYWLMYAAAESAHRKRMTARLAAVTGGGALTPEEQREIGMAWFSARIPEDMFPAVERILASRGGNQ